MASAKSTSTTSSAKRKRITYYAVKEGHKPDIYYSWSDVLEQITGHKDPKHESFPTLAEAEEFMRTGRSTKAKPSKQEYFYAVHTDRFDNVFADWPTASAAMKGHKGIKQQKFKTYEEAWASLERWKAGTPSEASAAVSTKSDKSKASKKQKKNDGLAIAVEPAVGDYEPGTGPLPPGAKDGFDNTIIFNPTTGTIEHKSDAQLGARKKQPTGEFSGPLEIWTDGSALGNGKVGAVAGLGVWFGPGDPRNLSEPVHGRQTNQRAELMAISRALDIAPIDRDVKIYSDSNYSIKCVTEWCKNWVKNKWKNSAGKLVENQDIIKPILDHIKERELAKATTEFQWIKGHGTNAGNIGADDLAVKGSQKSRREAAAPNYPGTEAKGAAGELSQSASQNDKYMTDDMRAAWAASANNEGMSESEDQEAWEKAYEARAELEGKSDWHSQLQREASD